MIIHTAPQFCVRLCVCVCVCVYLFCVTNVYKDHFHILIITNVHIFIFLLSQIIILIMKNSRILFYTLFGAICTKVQSSYALPHRGWQYIDTHTQKSTNTNMNSTGDHSLVSAMATKGATHPTTETVHVLPSSTMTQESGEECTHQRAAATSDCACALIPLVRTRTQRRDTNSATTEVVHSLECLLPAPLNAAQSRKRLANSPEDGRGSPQPGAAATHRPRTPTRGFRRLPQRLLPLPDRDGRPGTAPEVVLRTAPQPELVPRLAGHGRGRQAAKVAPRARALARGCRNEWLDEGKRV